MLERQLLDNAAIRAVGVAEQKCSCIPIMTVLKLCSLSEQSVVPLAGSRAAASEWVSRALRAAGP